MFFFVFYFEGTEDENEDVKSSVFDDSVYERCEKEAIRLALKYNFVTDVTSMVVKEDDEYVTKKNLEEKIVERKDEQQDLSVARSYAPVPRNSMNYAQSYNIFSTTTRFAAFGRKCNKTFVFVMGSFTLIPGISKW